MSPQSGLQDPFPDTVLGYATCRPRYPQALVDYLASQAPSHEVALDCACGLGQLSVPLAGAFERVVATDASAAQIANAEPCPRVEYQVALAERIPLGDASVDLITVAQGAHWLNLEAFYREARRVAKPEAILALISYGSLRIEGEAVDACVANFYHEVLQEYWPKERRYVETGYRTLPFPFTELEAPSLFLEAHWTLAGFLGHLNTWSAVRALEREQGLVALDCFVERLIRCWGAPHRLRRISWPLSLRVARL